MPYDQGISRPQGVVAGLLFRTGLALAAGSLLEDGFATGGRQRIDLQCQILI